MKRALLLQLALPRLNPLEEKGNIPLGPAYLKAYAQSVPSVGGTWALDILPRREADFLCAEDVAKRVLQERPETVGFSLFLWNIEKSLAVARRIHEERPETVFLFGGPEVTEENPLLAQEPLFQTGVIGEGERALSLLLKGVPPERVPGVLWRNREGRLVPPRALRPLRRFHKGLNPYLAGVLEPLPGEPLFIETVRGCPFQCGYCVYNKHYPQIHPLPRSCLRKTLRLARERGMAREIFLLDPSFNVQPEFEELLKLLKEENPGRVLEFHTELRADLLTDSQISLLEQMNLKGVEAGLQSITPEALRLMGRSQVVPRFLENCRKLTDRGVRVKVDLIAGLPGDTPEGFRKSAKRVKAAGLDRDIQVFPLSLLPGTRYRKMAPEWNLLYDPLPPYYVRQTPSFPAGRLYEELLFAQDLFDIDLAPLPPPLLATDPSGSTTPSQGVLGKFILETPTLPPLPSPLGENLTFHFRLPTCRGWQEPLSSSLKEVFRKHPLNIFTVLLELPSPPSREALDSWVSSLPLPPTHFLSRDYAPFFSPPPLLHVRFALILPSQVLEGYDLRELQEHWPLYLLDTGEDPERTLRLAEAEEPLYLKGVRQERLFSLLEGEDLLCDLTLFDSLALEEERTRRLFPEIRLSHPLMARL